MDSSRLKRIARASMQGAFLIVFAGLIYSNFLLERENAQLKAIARHGRAKSIMKVGEPFPTFFARDTGGKRIALAKDLGRDVRLLVVDPECPRCETVLAQLRNKNVQDVVVVSLRPRALSHKIVAGVGGAAPLYFVDREAPPILQSRIDVVPRVITVGAQGEIRELCHDLDECKPAGKACDTCSVSAGH
jgi:hypothetical protein